ncbi:hypothetical protein BcepSauron_408 [Burkholderia phage BcepSauron]|uniref:Uncharacterized protein n=1 Tax=Burkholderia phage BcepSauron TaxID=2530033 RepID=A0A482MMA3_9CAUD|nr:hypothetical protein H1O17_gp408 [Burkholderia phage BcepSauron]QBQ74788.1 hypothetical protein BcepSauron_408 [Burkholderia phage BcepSauron]
MTVLSKQDVALLNYIEIVLKRDTGADDALRQRFRDLRTEIENNALAAARYEAISHPLPIKSGSVFACLYLSEEGAVPVTRALHGADCDEAADAVLAGWAKEDERLNY